MGFVVAYDYNHVYRFSFQCGVDVNHPDSYDQSALDIVNKFTTSRAAKELKQLLKGQYLFNNIEFLGSFITMIGALDVIRGFA